MGSGFAHYQWNHNPMSYQQPYQGVSPQYPHQQQHYGNQPQYNYAPTRYPSWDTYVYLANTKRPNGRKVISGGMPIGWAVDREIKERIWADLYVDFAELVQGEDRSRTVTVDSDMGTTVSVQKQAKEIRTITEWDHAFSIYMNIYMD